MGEIADWERGREDAHNAQIEEDQRKLAKYLYSRYHESYSWFVIFSLWDDLEPHEQHHWMNEAARLMNFLDKHNI